MGCIEKVIIICPEHGEFHQRPSDHLSGYGCIKCGYKTVSKKLSDNLENVIKRLNEIHENFYDYKNITKYTNNKDVIYPICPIHGEWKTILNNHLNGHKCPHCTQQSFPHTKETFIQKAILIHGGNKYDYSNVKYCSNKRKVCIICLEHGEFWQRPNDHLNGVGCPYCIESKLEREIRIFLKKNNIKYKTQEKPKWLKYNGNQQSLDFYLPEYNIAIECQGDQHFCPIKHFGGEKTFHDTLLKDINKNKLCKVNNMTLFYLIKDENVNIEDEIFENMYHKSNTFTNKEKIIEIIYQKFGKVNLYL